MGKIIVFKVTKGENSMCTIAESIRKKGYSDETAIIERANDILDYFNVRPIEQATPVIWILSEMGIKAFQSEMDPKELSAYITVNPEYIDTFGTSKIACVNEELKYGHKRFALAHELAHYLFDYKESEDATYYNTYYPGHDTTREEKRANLFAANLLLPEQELRKKYEEYKEKFNSIPDTMLELCEFFGVTYTCMKKRFEEIGLGEL